MAMTPSDHERLKTLAEQASDKPWEASVYSERRYRSLDDSAGRIMSGALTRLHEPGNPNTVLVDVAFVNAMSPAVALSMLAAVEELARRDEATAIVARECLTEVLAELAVEDELRKRAEHAEAAFERAKEAFATRVTDLEAELASLRAAQAQQDRQIQQFVAWVRSKAGVMFDGEVHLSEDEFNAKLRECGLATATIEPE